MEAMPAPPEGGGETPPGQQSSDSSSAEFEFWMVGNPSFPQPNLLSADELFVDGVLVPLHLLPNSSNSTGPTTEPEISSSSAADRLLEPFPSAPSSRWKDLFRSEKKRDRKVSSAGSSSGGGGMGVAELNINIWPFSRSRSAGTSAAGTSSRQKASGRKSSSAPCSRSNSRGESSKAPVPGGGRRLGSIPARPVGGVHLGRSTPIWQLKRGAKKATEQHKDNVGGNGKSGSDAGAGAGSGAGGDDGKKSLGNGGGSSAVGIRVLNLNVNACIGYRQRGSCGEEDKGALAGGEQTRRADGSNGNHFNIKTLFSKKVY